MDPLIWPLFDYHKGMFAPAKLKPRGSAFMAGGKFPKAKKAKRKSQRAARKANRGK